MKRPAVALAAVALQVQAAGTTINCERLPGGYGLTVPWSISAVFDERARSMVITIDPQKHPIAAVGATFSELMIEATFNRHDGTPGRLTIFRDRGALIYEVSTSPPTKSYYECTAARPRF